MKIIALMPCRNEAWIVGLSLRAALLWSDEAVVLDHASTDETPAILAEIAAEHPGRVDILTESDGTWREMAHRQRLLDAARARGATHCAIVDADELLTGDMLPVIRGAVESLAPNEYLRTRMFCMWRNPNQYRHDGSVWSNRRDLAAAFPVTPDLCWRTAAGYDHHHREPYGVRRGGVFLNAPGGIMHMQFADWRRLVAKHALYKITERLRWPDKPVAEIDRMYSQALDERGIGLAPAPAEWWAPYQPWLNYLDCNSEPWQDAEVRRLLALHGLEKFSGLNLYGVGQ